MNTAYKTLLAYWQDIQNISQAVAVLQWDQSTYMPEGGAKARGRQMAALEVLAHEKLVSTQMKQCLEAVDCAELSDSERRCYEIIQHDYLRQTRLTPEFVRAHSEHVSNMYNAWTQAKPASDFKTMLPYLEKELEFRQQQSQFYNEGDHPLDALIADSDEGLTVQQIRKIFSEFRDQLVSLVKKITTQPLVDNSCLLRPYALMAQEMFGKSVALDLGYDFKRGRLDVTHHPFCTSFSINDVRITTRYNPHDFGDAFFSIVHEAGHAMYEQNINLEFENTPLASGTSMSVHESQSRLWENLVARSETFWNYYFQKLAEFFPEALQNTTSQTFYKAINRVEPSLIRVDADEVTYNLHVMIRFELECQLFEGKLAVKDLPEAWAEAYKRDLGVDVPDHKNGVLQDVHWYSGALGGYFQSYTLGNLMSVMFFNSATEADSTILPNIQKGEFVALKQWLTQNIYQFGKLRLTQDTLAHATKQKLSSVPFMDYLQKKYAGIYKLG